MYPILFVLTNLYEIKATLQKIRLFIEKKEEKKLNY
jgi:hypothetical protein